MRVDFVANLGPNKPRTLYAQAPSHMPPPPSTDSTTHALGGARCQNQSLYCGKQQTHEKQTNAANKIKYLQAASILSRRKTKSRRHYTAFLSRNGHSHRTTYHKGQATLDTNSSKTSDPLQKTQLMHRASKKYDQPITSATCYATPHVPVPDFPRTASHRCCPAYTGSCCRCAPRRYS